MRNLDTVYPISVLSPVKPYPTTSFVPFGIHARLPHSAAFTAPYLPFLPSFHSRSHGCRSFRPEKIQGYSVGHFVDGEYLVWLVLFIVPLLLRFLLMGFTAGSGMSMTKRNDRILGARMVDGVVVLSCRPV